MEQAHLSFAVVFFGSNSIPSYHIALLTSVGDPEPDPEPDPHVSGPSGSGSISQRYGSGSFPFLIKVLSGLK
jgi:hypothetical protein